MPKKLKLVKSLKKTTLKKRKKLKLVPSLNKKLNKKKQLNIDQQEIQ